MKRFDVYVNYDWMCSKSSQEDAISWAQAFTANHAWAISAQVVQMFGNWHAVLVWSSPSLDSL